MSQQQTMKALAAVAGAVVFFYVVGRASYLASLHPLATARKYPRKINRINRAVHLHVTLVYSSNWRSEEGANYI